MMRWNYFGLLVLLFSCLLAPDLLASAGGGHGAEAAQTFPMPLHAYGDSGYQSIWKILENRIHVDPFNLIATVIFLCAILHTFLGGKFRNWAHVLEEKHREKIEREGRTAAAKPQEDAEDDVSFGARIFHFLGEVEAVFGIWVVPLFIAIICFYDRDTMTHYVTYTVNYTEPAFVVVVMSIASSRPVLRFAEGCLAFVARFGRSTPAAWWFSILTVAPLLGSFITEPAAMTIGALLLSKKFYSLNPSSKFKYATLGLLFVNVSVGGTLTNFAAPPVLMVARTWEWSSAFMLTHFGWKAALGILASNLLYLSLFKKEFAKLVMPKEDTDSTSWVDRDDPVPVWVVLMHVLFLGWTVYNAHFPPMFVGGFLFFIAFTEATVHHQNPLSIRSAMLVGFFLAGLVTHGGCQQWWIQPVLSSLTEWPLMIGSTILTSFNDNAAITYLSSLVPGFSPQLKYAVVAGAVTGGGLTVIANAPNPAGQSILSKFFEGGVSAIYLVAGAIIPTLILGACFMLF